MKRGHGKTQEYGYFGESPTSEQSFCQPLSVQVVPCGLSGQELFPLHSIFNQTHPLATCASYHCMAACLLSLKLLTAKNTEYTPHYSSYLYADF